MNNHVLKTLCPRWGFSLTCQWRVSKCELVHRTFAKPGIAKMEEFVPIGPPWPCSRHFFLVPRHFWQQGFSWMNNTLDKRTFPSPLHQSRVFNFTVSRHLHTSSLSVFSLVVRSCSSFLLACNTFVFLLLLIHFPLSSTSDGVEGLKEMRLLCIRLMMMNDRR